jgi:glycine/serine hydroxymethyltransferase
LKESDPEVFGFIQGEYERQKNGIQLIASEVCSRLISLSALPISPALSHPVGFPLFRFYSFILFLSELWAPSSLTA